MDERSLEALLADPRRRPPEGWSARAEAFADASWTGWRDTFALWREEQRLALAETDAELLYAALEAERSRARGLERQLQVVTGRQAA
jgi:hypothetical protein